MAATKRSWRKPPVPLRGNVNLCVSGVHAARVEAKSLRHKTSTTHVAFLRRSYEHRFYSRITDNGQAKGQECNRFSCLKKWHVTVLTMP